MIATSLPLDCSITFRPVADSAEINGPGAAPAPSLLAAALRRCARAGLRVVITAPADVRAFSRGVMRFPERLIEPGTHARYGWAYRNFKGAADNTQDRGSWRVLVLDNRSRVVGAVTARFFCGETSREYVHALSLLAGNAPVFCNECDLAVGELFSRAQRYARTPAEISHWSVADGRHARLVTVTLIRAMLALSVAFDLPLALVAADHQRGELARFMRWATTPLGRRGKFYLPPFVHRASGTRLRLLVVDTSALGARLRGAAIDLGVLRERCPIISVQ
jgi:hypothetical protein